MPRSAYVVLVFLCAFAVFLADRFTPRGFIVSALYLFPVFLSMGVRSVPVTLSLALGAIVLMWVEYFVSTPYPGVPEEVSVFNKILSTVTVALAAAIISVRLEAERTLYERIRRQQAVALFGRHALTIEESESLMDEACRVLAEFFAVNYCKILKHEPQAQHVVLINGFGWSPEDMGWTESTEGDSFAAYTFRHDHDEPLIVHDLPHERRFRPPKLLLERGIVSCVNVLIPGKEVPYGILEVDTVRPRYFKKEDAYILQLMANILGDAIERCRVQQTLIQSNRGLEEFASIASHDLQEPLRKIFTFSDRVQPLVNSEEGQSYLAKTRSAANRMKSLIDDLLLFSKLKVGESGAFKPIDTNELIQDVIDGLELRIQEKGAVVNIQSGLPTVLGNYFQVHQLFTNLVSNALKYVPSGKVPVVRIKGQVKGREAEFSVQDNGIGFDEKYADEIFRPFKRLHGKGQFEGTGMGLTISKRVVEQHKGRIWAKGTPDNGATFFVTLPLVPSDKKS
jgi:signal transduction histidine kinase